MSIMRVLNSKGDEEISFSADDQKAVALAREEFDKKMDSKLYAAFKLGDGDTEQIKKFDENAKEIILVKQLVGG